MQNEFYQCICKLHFNLQILVQQNVKYDNLKD